MVRERLVLLFLVLVLCCVQSGVVNAQKPGSSSEVRGTLNSDTTSAEVPDEDDAGGAQASGPVENGGDAAGSGSEESVQGEGKEKEYVWGKYGLEVHGSLIGFFQGGAHGRIEGENIGDSSSGGISADLEIGYKPPVPLFENGRFFFHLHAGEGKGADTKFGDKLFASFNDIAIYNGDLQLPSDKALWLHEAYYEHTFLGGKLSFLAGKTDALALIDDNAFANDSAVQFVGVAFVNNPVLYNEDEYAPIISATFSPVESLKLTALAVSSSRPFGEEGIQKSVYSRVFNQPLVAAQLTYSPKFWELEGNYRIYYFNATYDHVNSADTFSKDGWGVGLSLDQQISPCLGLFARLAYHGKDAYDVDWFWSAGANFKKLIPSRDEDALGIGIAGVKGHIGPDNDGTEFHAETYYRIVLNKYVALSPDFQWVVNPRGNSGNGTVFAGMLRLEMSF